MNYPNAELAISDGAAEIAAAPPGPVADATAVRGPGALEPALRLSQPPPPRPSKTLRARVRARAGRRLRDAAVLALREAPPLSAPHAHSRSHEAVALPLHGSLREAAPPRHGHSRDAAALQPREEAVAGAGGELARADHAAAVRDAARALLGSRALIWLAAAAVLLTFGYGPLRHAFNPPHTTQGFGWLGDLLAAPAARWDSSWYLVIAHYGYRPDLGQFTAARAAFFPLYPLGISALSRVGVSAVLAGVLISLAALAFALYGLHRLTTLELARSRPLAERARVREVARLAVLLTAFGPMALFLSAVYSESLYLALSIGVFYAARTGRFALACALGALAGATRSAGLLLLLPVLILYFYGPREDRVPDFTRTARRGASRMRRFALTLAPRYRVRRDALWMALFPAGLLLFMVFLALDGSDALAPFHAQQDWGREFAGPLAGLWDGVSAAFQGVRQLLSMQTQHAYFPIAVKDTPMIAASHNLVDFAFLLAAVPALVALFRRLPFAYFAYVLAALALALSYPILTEPLMSLPRFLLVLFPLTIAAAAWLSEHPRVRAPALALSAAYMAVAAAQFATWHWVA